MLKISKKKQEKKTAFPAWYQMAIAAMPVVGLFAVALGVALGVSVEAKVMTALITLAGIVVCRVLRNSDGLF